MEKLRDKTKEIDLEELVPLVVEWREERASRAKCPYCVKPIEKQATKCNHCLSEIEWFQFGGLYGPCKIGEAEEMERPLVIARAAFQAAAAGERAALKEEKENKIKELKEAVCPKCSKPIFAHYEIQHSSSLEQLKKFEERYRVYTGEFKCRECGKAGCLLFLLAIGGGIALMIFLAEFA
ncbi:hypothetical protein OAG67_00690 [bacterium]|nr:hypothetical protein [bacterium]MDB4723984.1 hypothetical protein [Akkermansiaceae bacterium]MDB4761639.1 hypothetical protein [bacterium]MDB4810678.1 hypothetical protein [Akkermansiaceae bacterium]